MLEGDPPPPLLHLHPEWPLLHDGGLDLLDRWLTLHPDCRLVVVDVLAKIRGRTSDRESAYSADYGQLTAIKVVADRHNVAAVVVHHTRKASSEDFLDDVSGTQGIAGAADATLVLKRVRGSADAVLKVASRDVEDVEHALKLAGGRWVMLDGPATDYELGDTRLQILRAIRETGPMSPKQVSDSIDVDRELVRKTMQRMASDAQLGTHGGGTYFVPVPLSHLSQVSQTEPLWDSRDTWDTPPELTDDDFPWGDDAA